MKKEDMLILTNLRENSRESLRKLSRKTAIPMSTLYDKLKNYEKNVIKKYTMLIDFSSLGFSTKATILLKVTKDYREKLAEHLTKEKHINNVYKINNGYDFIIEGIFRELKDIDAFLIKLETEYGVVDNYIYYIVDELKREGFMSSPEYVKITGDFC